MTRQGDAARDKETAARIRSCFERDRTHLRVGNWRGPLDCEVTVVAESVWDLRGTVCTCCPRRTA